MRALVIDDEKGVRNTLAQQLRAKCFAVDTAEDGVQGSYLAREARSACCPRSCRSIRQESSVATPFRTGFPWHLVYTLGRLKRALLPSHRIRKGDEIVIKGI
jgi:CheY-like chemotaxis protein